MGEFNTNTNINNNNKSNISNNFDNDNVVTPDILNDERYIFGNLFGYIPDKYVKYFNLFALHLVSTIFLD
jgi:hypothetical protein